MTGAAVLVLLLVVLAPALLNGRVDGDDAVAPDMAANPDRRTEVIVLNAPVTAAPEAAEVVEEVIEPAAQKAPPPEVDPAIVAAARKKAVAVKPAANKRPPQGFAVQLGGFSKRSNAERYASRVKSEGYPVFVVKGVSGGGTIYRVYSGPEDSRAAAGELAGKLQGSGHSVMVVQLGG